MNTETYTICYVTNILIQRSTMYLIRKKIGLEYPVPAWLVRAWKATLLSKPNHERSGRRGQTPQSHFNHVLFSRIFNQNMLYVALFL